MRSSASVSSLISTGAMAAPDPGRDLVADHECASRPGEPGLEVAGVVEQVAAGERVDQHREGGLRGGLLVHRLAVGAAREA